MLISRSASVRAMRIRRIIGTWNGAALPGTGAIVSPSRQLAVADAYDALPDWDDAAVPAFRAFADETMMQYRIMIGTGSISHVVEDSDPYATAGAMIESVERDGIIRTMSTRATGGHPFLTDSQNDAFRAVHDVVGHAATGRGFDRHGEEAALQSHAVMYSPLARVALISETRGQNSSMIKAGGTFPAQKIAILPGWARGRDALVPTANEYAAALAQARTMHAAGGLS